MLCEPFHLRQTPVSKFGVPAVASFLVLSVPEDEFVFKTCPLPQSSLLISQGDTKMVSLISSERIQPCLCYTPSSIYLKRCPMTLFIRKTIWTIKIIGVLSDLALSMYFEDFWQFINNCRHWFNFFLFKYLIHVSTSMGEGVGVHERTVQDTLKISL